MTKSVAAFTQTDTLPAHLQAGSGLGNENIDNSAVTISRIDLIQSLSPQLEADNANFIDGAKVGDMFDTVTGELYQNVFLVNLHFATNFAVFKKRTLGGGFEGTFATEAEALSHLQESKLPVEQYDISETHVHSCLLLDEKGVPKKPVNIYMSGSKIKVSRAWNTAILTKNQGADRFATVWVATSIKEKNKQNQPYQNFKVDFAGFCSEALYDEAKDNYLAFKGQTA